MPDAQKQKAFVFSHPATKARLATGFKRVLEVLGMLSSGDQTTNPQGDWHQFSDTETRYLLVGTGDAVLESLRKLQSIGPALAVLQKCPCP